MSKSTRLQEMIDDDDLFAGWIVSTFTVADLLEIQGVWEPVSEELNNDWIDHCEETFSGGE